jgi:hypothetical protein
MLLSFSTPSFLVTFLAAAERASGALANPLGTLGCPPWLFAGRMAAALLTATGVGGTDSLFSSGRNFPWPRLVFHVLGKATFDHAGDEFFAVWVLA